MDDTKQRVNSCLEQSNSPEVFIFIRTAHSQSVYKENFQSTLNNWNSSRPLPSSNLAFLNNSGKKCQNYGSSEGIEQRRYRDKLFSRWQLERKWILRARQKQEKDSRRGRSWECPFRMLKRCVTNFRDDREDG